MPNKLQFGAAILAVMIAKDLIDGPYKRKYVEIVGKYNSLVEEHNALAADVSHLVRVLNDHEVELDELDLLVLTNVTKKDS